MKSCYRPAEQFLSYRPDLGPVIDAPDIQVALCVKANASGTFTSEYRLALNASKHVSLRLNLAVLLGKNPLDDGVYIVYTFDPKTVHFRENSLVSDWFSVLDDLCAESSYIEDVSGQEMSYEERLTSVKHLMSMPENALSMRFEVEVVGDKGLVLLLRALPETKANLMKNSRFRSMNVPTVSVARFETISLAFPNTLEDLYASSPVAPIIFGPSPLQSITQVREAVSGGIGPILSFLQVHGEHDVKSVRAFMKLPTGKTGNVQKYPQPTSRKRVHTTNVSLDPSTGMFQCAKFGPRFDLRCYAPRLPRPLLKLSCLSLSTSTWTSYKVCWNMFCDFCSRSSIAPSLPVSLDNLLNFVQYLAETRQLKEQSIRSYISALRYLHKLNRVKTTVFDSPFLQILYQGVKNHQATYDTSGNSRRVVTWEVLLLLGHLLFTSNTLHDFDKQTIWTLCLVAFFGSCRMGELIVDSPYIYNVTSFITWEKIRVLSKHNYTILISLPKVSEDPRGFVLNLFEYTDEKYCPLRNIDKVLRNATSQGSPSYGQPVFVLFSGKLVTKSFMNRLLHTLLTPYFPPHLGTFTCHSFRAGIPSIMASCPEKFSEEETKLAGRWASNAYKRYTRLTGLAQ